MIMCLMDVWKKQNCPTDCVKNIYNPFSILFGRLQGSKNPQAIPYLAIRIIYKSTFLLIVESSIQ